jgi:hypothetical protein
VSFNELAVSIIAQNLASAEFSRVASDAGAMAVAVSSQRMEIHVENFASPQINQIAQDAQVSFQEVSVSAVQMGENVRDASDNFTEMQKHAESSSKSLRMMASEIRITAMMGTQIIG